MIDARALTPEEARKDLQNFMSDYLSTKEGMPPELHVFANRDSTKGWTPAMWELSMLQQIYRRMAYLRGLLAAGLYACACGSIEGEHHVNGCGFHPNVVRRPKGWVPTNQPAANDGSGPVEIHEHVEQKCAKASDGCIYVALPGSKFCAQHQG